MRRGGAMMEASMVRRMENVLKRSTRVEPAGETG